MIWYEVVEFGAHDAEVIGCFTKKKDLLKGPIHGSRGMATSTGLKYPTRMEAQLKALEMYKVCNNPFIDFIVMQVNSDTQGQKWEDEWRAHWNNKYKPKRVDSN